MKLKGDTSLRTFERPDNVTVPGSKPAFTTSSLSDAIAGKSYSAQVEASSETPVEYSISGITSGWEDDFKCSSKGLITGTPSKSGTVKITVRAVNYVGKVSKTFTINVNSTGIRPTITTASLTEGTLGGQYSVQLTATGTTPITWAVSELPEGRPWRKAHHPPHPLKQ